MSQHNTPTEGSTLYYSLLYSTEQAKQNYLKCQSVISSLSSVLHDVSEADIAQKKIHWWHEEIDRAFEGKAKHPTTEAYQAQLMDWPEAREHCMSVLSIAAKERYGAAQTDAELIERTTQDYTARMALLHHAVCKQSPIVSHWTPTANALGLFDRLAELPFYIHRGYDVFSLERYKLLDVTPGKLANCDAATRKALSNHLVATALNAFQSANNCPADSKPCLALMTLANIRQKQLLLWKKVQPDLLHERVALTPLRKFFVAWNTKRRF